MIYYLDSSIAVQAVLPTPQRAHLIEWMNGKELLSSRLLRTEVLRTLRREKRPTSEATWLLESVNLMDITRLVHTMAETIEHKTRTLDSLHLGTAIAFGAPVIVASHDQQMLEVARELGFATTDPCRSSSSRAHRRSD